jgi:IclR family mhp operon transcriptional activator
MDDKVPIRTVSRAITVLRAINRHGSLNMMSIARASGLSYPTAFRLVRTLIHEGLIEREPSRKHYRPTALVQELSVGYRPHNELVSLSRPYLEELTHAIGWPVSLTSPVGMSMVLRDSTHARTTLTFEHYPPGFTFPLAESASGHLFLALAAEDVVEEVVHWMGETEAGEEALVHFPSPTTLNLIRERGFAVKAWGRYNLNPGRTSAISVPIFRRGVFDAALTLIFFASAMSAEAAIERYMDQLKRCAGSISDAISSGAA